MMQFPSGAITGMGVSAKERLVGVISEDGGCAAVCLHHRVPSVRRPTL